MRVTFIAPCYNEQDNVDAFYEAFESAFDGIDWRLVMVDDGSSDATFGRLRRRAASDARVCVISFSRNFGKEAAIYAGLQEAVGSDYVGIIDADLQQRPSTAREMLETLLREPDYDCVAAYQEHRREGVLSSFVKRSFYRVFMQTAHATTMIENASDFRVFRGEVAHAILSLPEYHRFSKGIFAWIGFKTYAYPYTPDARNAGQTKWSLWSLMRYALEGILSFSTQPLHSITGLGFVTFLLSLCYVIVLISKTLVQGVDVPGYASIVALVLMFGGTQLLAMGVMGEYLSRLYEQEKQRPIYLIRRRINGKGESLES